LWCQQQTCCQRYRRKRKNGHTRRPQTDTQQNGHAKMHSLQEAHEWTHKRGTLIRSPITSYKKSLRKPRGRKQGRNFSKKTYAKTHGAGQTVKLFDVLELHAAHTIATAGEGACAGAAEGGIGRSRHPVSPLVQLYEHIGSIISLWLLQSASLRHSLVS